MTAFDTAAYINACAAAATEQGLDPLRHLPGVTIEQTGGFTMVATIHRPDGGYVGITCEADGYLICDYPTPDSEGEVMIEGLPLSDLRDYLLATGPYAGRS